MYTELPECIFNKKVMFNGVPVVPRKKKCSCKLKTFFLNWFFFLKYVIMSEFMHFLLHHSSAIFVKGVWYSAFHMKYKCSFYLGLISTCSSTLSVAIHPDRNQKYCVFSSQLKIKFVPLGHSSVCRKLFFFPFSCRGFDIINKSVDWRAA